MTDSPTNEEGKSALVPLGMLATAVVLLLAMVALAGWAHFQVGADAKIPIHWNAKGEVDGYAGKGGLWFTPVSTAVLLVLLIGVPFVEPRQGKKLLRSKMYHVVLFGMLGVMLAIQIGIVFGALGKEFPMTPVLFSTIGIMFVVMGNFFGKVRSNYVMGVRTPWTLSSELSWNKTHRLAGRLFVIYGLATIAVGWVDPGEWVVLTVIIGGVIAIIAITFPYSYFVWKNDPNREANPVS